MSELVELYEKSNDVFKAFIMQVIGIINAGNVDPLVAVFQDVDKMTFQEIKAAVDKIGGQ